MDAGTGGGIHVGVADNAVTGNALARARRGRNHVHQFGGIGFDTQVRGGDVRTITNTRDGAAAKLSPANGATQRVPGG